MTTSSAGGKTTPRRYSHAVGAVVLAVLVLTAAACSKKSPTAPVTDQDSSATTADASTSGWTLALTVVPDHPRMVRPATFAVHIRDSGGKPVEYVQVTGSLNMTLMDMGKTAVKFEPKGAGDYEAKVPSFDMSGPWEVTIDAIHGALHARKVFQITVLD
jgi:nitrogen fixation protein FixH